MKKTRTPWAKPPDERTNQVLPWEKALDPHELVRARKAIREGEPDSGGDEPGDEELDKLDGKLCYTAGTLRPVPNDSRRARRLAIGHRVINDPVDPARILEDMATTKDTEGALAKKLKQRLRAVQNARSRRKNAGTTSREDLAALTARETSIKRAVATLTFGDRGAGFVEEVARDEITAFRRNVLRQRDEQVIEAGTPEALRESRMAALRQQRLRRRKRA